MHHAVCYFELVDILLLLSKELLAENMGEENHNPRSVSTFFVYGASHTGLNNAVFHCSVSCQLSCTCPTKCILDSLEGTTKVLRKKDNLTIRSAKSADVTWR